MIELDATTKDFCAKWIAVCASLSLIICAISLPIVFYQIERAKSDNEIAKEAMKYGYEQKVYDPKSNRAPQIIWVEKEKK